MIEQRNRRDKPFLAFTIEELVRAILAFALIARGPGQVRDFLDCLSYLSTGIAEHSSLNVAE